MLWLSLLLLQPAQAARNATPEGYALPDAGRVRLQLTPGAEIQEVPQVQPGRFKLVIRGSGQRAVARLDRTLLEQVLLPEPLELVPLELALLRNEQEQVLQLGRYG